jgi:hypothetical protein
MNYGTTYATVVYKSTPLCGVFPGVYGKYAKTYHRYATAYLNRYAVVTSLALAPWDGWCPLNHVHSNLFKRDIEITAKPSRSQQNPS